LGSAGVGPPQTLGEAGTSLPEPQGQMKRIAPAAGVMLGRVTPEPVGGVSCQNFASLSKTEHNLRQSTDPSNEGATKRVTLKLIP
jgi:hypothetical protein